MVESGRRSFLAERELNSRISHHRSWTLALIIKNGRIQSIGLSGGRFLTIPNEHKTADSTCYREGFLIVNAFVQVEHCPARYRRLGRNETSGGTIKKC